MNIREESTRQTGPLFRAIALRPSPLLPRARTGFTAQISPCLPHPSPLIHTHPAPVLPGALLRRALPVAPCKPRLRRYQETQDGYLSSFAAPTWVNTGGEYEDGVEELGWA
jgi:hypothetical protein